MPKTVVNMSIAIVTSPPLTIWLACWMSLIRRLTMLPVRSFE
jgi:hypothetical protein